jgi:DNA-binding CsgD family transcriptional regulator
MLIPENTNYRDYINRLKTGYLKPILATSYINTDNSVSVFFHEVESKLEAYQLFRDRSYILSLRSIEKNLHSNPDLINNSTYSKRLVRPLNLGRIKNFVNNKIRFTKREYSILNCIYNGLYSSKMIALKLKCSYRTIDEYLTNLKIKLNVPNKYALIMEVSNNYLHY